MHKHLVSSTDLTKQDIERLIKLSEDIMKSPERYRKACEGKILATLFLEPSTRTRLSFESAMLSLGGQILGFSSAEVSSAAKGESLTDTIRVVSGYADISVIRHPKEGSALLASQYSKIPVINAGDGGHQHPTQTLTDILTISMSKGRLDNLNIGLCGDLKFGRTVHSLLECMQAYDNRFTLVSPSELKIPDYLKRKLNHNGVNFTETESLEDAIGDMDILYMTRVQKERFFNEEDYVRLKDTYILDQDKLEKAKPDLAILHPLPRVNEISTEIDDDPRALYFKQAENGRFIRMALILELLGLGGIYA